MSKKNLIFWSFVNSFSALIYISLVSLVLFKGEQIFGRMKDIIGPIVLLLLFVISATVMATLILGRPIWFYLNNKKKESLFLFFYTLGWLFVFLFAALLINVLK